ncbi:MAG: hypothetical protein ACKO1N_01995, partial [Erythrobacter sp.]
LLVIALLLALAALAPQEAAPPSPPIDGQTATPTETNSDPDEAPEPAPAPSAAPATPAAPEVSEALSGNYSDAVDAATGFTGIYVTVIAPTGTPFAVVDANMQLTGSTLVIPMGENLRTVVQATEYWLVQRSDGTVGYVHAGTINFAATE